MAHTQARSLGVLRYKMRSSGRLVLRWAGKLGSACACVSAGRLRWAGKLSSACAFVPAGRSASWARLLTSLRCLHAGW